MGFNQSLELTLQAGYHSRVGRSQEDSMTAQRLAQGTHTSAQTNSTSVPCVAMQKAVAYKVQCVTNAIAKTKVIVLYLPCSKSQLYALIRLAIDAS